MDCFHFRGGVDIFVTCLTDGPQQPPALLALELLLRLLRAQEVAALHPCVEILPHVHKDRVIVQTFTTQDEEDEGEAKEWSRSQCPNENKPPKHKTEEIGETTLFAYLK